MTPPTRSPRSPEQRRFDDRSGYALLGVLVFIIVMGIIGFSFFAMAGYETRATQVDLDSQRAFWLAEAARERAMKHMKGRQQPPDYDQPIYTGVAGPYGGSYTVSVLVDTSAIWSAEKAFVLESVGTFGSSQRRIRQRIKMNSFADYGYFTDDERAPGGGPIWFATGNVIEGLIHSNGRFHINGSPQFLGKVTSASDRMIGAPNFNVFGPAGWPVGGNNPNFAQGFDLNVPNIPLPTSTGNIAAEALADGISVGPSATLEFGRSGNGAGVVDLGSFRYQPTAGGGMNWTSVQISTLVQPLFYSDGNVQVKGILDGEFTVASDDDIIIIDDLTYAASDAAGKPLPGCNDLLGLVAENDIVFADNAQTDLANSPLKVNAILMALDTSIGAQNYNNGAKRGTLTIWGGLIQKYRGAVGLIDNNGNLTSGYQKDYHYDPRVTARKPPQFPLTGVYEEVAWSETWDATNPF